MIKIALVAACAALTLTACSGSKPKLQEGPQPVTSAAVSSAASSASPSALPDPAPTVVGLPKPVMKTGTGGDYIVSVGVGPLSVMIHDQLRAMGNDGSIIEIITPNPAVRLSLSYGASTLDATKQWDATVSRWFGKEPFQASDLDSGHLPIDVAGSHYNVPATQILTFETAGQTYEAGFFDGIDAPAVTSLLTVISDPRGGTADFSIDVVDGAMTPAQVMSTIANAYYYLAPAVSYALLHAGSAASVALSSPNTA